MWIDGIFVHLSCIFLYLFSLSESFVHFAEIIRSPSFLIFLHIICTGLVVKNSSFPKTTFPDFGQLEYSHNLDAFLFCAFAQIIGSLHLLSLLTKTFAQSLHLAGIDIHDHSLRNSNWVTTSTSVCTIFTFGRN